MCIGLHLACMPLKECATNLEARIFVALGLVSGQHVRTLSENNLLADVSYFLCFTNRRRLHVG